MTSDRPPYLATGPPLKAGRAWRCFALNPGHAPETADAVHLNRRPALSASQSAPRDNLVQLYPAALQSLTPLASYATRATAVCLRHAGDQAQRNARALSDLLLVNDAGRGLRTWRGLMLESTRATSSLLLDLTQLAQTTFDELVDQAESATAGQPDHRAAD